MGMFITCFEIVTYKIHNHHAITMFYNSLKFFTFIYSQVNPDIVIDKNSFICM